MRRPLTAVILASAIFVACGTEGRRASDAPTDPGAATPRAPSTRGGVATTRPRVLSKTAFVAAENAICREYDSRVDALGEPEPGEYAPWLRKYIGILDHIQKKSKAARPPADAQDDYDRYLRQNEAQATALESALPKLEKADRDDDIEAADEVLDDAFTVFDRIADEQDPWARSYGLSECVDEEPPGATSA